MTGEEAKKEIIDMANALQLIPNTPKGKAVSMALKALEQEPCEDAISRQAMINIIDSWLSLDDYNGAERHIMRAVQSELYDLPPVTPQPKRGHWIWQTEDIYKCSECWEDIRVKEVMNKPQYVYCPNCGAEMEVEK